MNKLKIEWMLERGHDPQNDEKLIKLLDSNGIDLILIRTASIFPDPWTIAAKYCQISHNVKFLIAVNPAMMHPVYCAMKIATFQKLFGNRISINVVSGASKVEQSVFNDNTPIHLRYKRTGEFAQIIKKLVIDGRIDKFNGEFYNLKDVDIIPGQDFEIVFAGSSDNTIELANNFGSAHYYAMETLKQYSENRYKIKVDSAIKTTLITEEDSLKAWNFASSLLEGATEDHINELKKDLSSHESENQKRQQALHNFSKDNLNIEKNIWSGMGLLRGGGITTMVGSYTEVADLIDSFYHNGLNRILIGASPELHYANNFINGVMPILKERNII